MTDYAVYKGEKLLALGTIDACAKALNVTTKTLFFYGTPTYKKRTKNGRTLIKL